MPEYIKILSDDNLWVNQVSDLITFDLIINFETTPDQRKEVVVYCRNVLSIVNKICRDSHNLEDKILALKNEEFNKRHKIRAYIVSIVLSIWAYKSLHREKIINEQNSKLYDILRNLVFSV